MADSEIARDVREAPFAEALSERYLSYALSTIMSRSLPDVRDGLKPVHRRLLYAMRQLKLDPNTSYKKSARVVGDVIGKFHPHGDQAVYDALVRLAQDFAVRYPLIDGQGNFGNIDGDGAAAMRYTEARLTPFASALMEGLDADAVDFRPTYDGEAEEPVVMPASLPNLLLNGASGIAVGMACSIPPHNLGEVCDALVHLIDHPRASVETLVERMPGPDLPTGGVLVESKGTIVSAYGAGKGSLRVRARWQVETLKGGAYQVVVTEIPYQVQKAKLVERIADLLEQRKVPLLGDVRDESTEDVRLVLEPKSRNVEADLLMESLFRQCDLESKLQINMNVLDAQGVPQVMSLPKVLQAYIDHRHDVLGRQTRHRLARIAHRLEVLGGLLVAYLNLDEVIRIIREEDEPKPVLIRTFDLSDLQAESILNMRLRSLRKLEEMEIRREDEALKKEQADLKALLDDPEAQRRTVRDQIKAAKKTYGTKGPLAARRTEIAGAPQAREVPQEASVEREPITVLVSERGWIRALKGHVSGTDQKHKEGDRGRFVLHAATTDKLLLFTSDGRFYTLTGDKLPGGRSFGEPLRLMLDIRQDVDFVSLRPHDPDSRLLVASASGRGFIVPGDQLVAQKRGGKQVLDVADGDRAVACVAVPDGADHVAVMGTNRKLLIFPLDQLTEMGKGRGLRLQRYKEAELADIKPFRLADGLTWRLGERTRTEHDLRAWIGDRATAGRLPPNGFPRSNTFGTEEKG